MELLLANVEEVHGFGGGGGGGGGGYSNYNTLPSISTIAESDAGLNPSPRLAWTVKTSGSSTTLSSSSTILTQDWLPLVLPAGSMMLVSMPV